MGCSINQQFALADPFQELQNLRRDLIGGCVAANGSRA